MENSWPRLAWLFNIYSGITFADMSQKETLNRMLNFYFRPFAVVSFMTDGHIQLLFLSRVQWGSCVDIAINMTTLTEQ